MTTSAPENTAYAVTQTRIYSADIETVFNALIDPETVKRWMYGPDTTVVDFVLQPEIGGRFFLLMRGQDREWPHEGKITHFERPNRLAYTWLSPSTKGRETHVDITLTAIEVGKTELVLVHTALPDTYAAFDQGWAELLVNLGVTLG